MPELPEVQTMVNGIAAAVSGRRILEMQFCDCRCRPIAVSPEREPFSAAVRGQRVTQVDRLGKRVLLLLETDSAIVIEPRMTGLLLIDAPPDEEHLRVCWRLGRRRDERLWFWDRRGLGTVRLLNEAALAQLREARLGPDALQMTVDRWRERLAGTARPIKVALLDQSLVCGIGNLYASEILHRARIHPERPANRLALRQVVRLHESTQQILLAAIEHEGSTLSDGTYRNALNRNGRYQNAHTVYMKDGTCCAQCERGTIRRIVQAQRSTFYCPVCQRQPRWLALRRPH